MKKLKIIVLFLIAVVFVLVPLPAADMNVRLHFQEAQGKNCALYYTTVDSPLYSGDKYIPADIDYEKMQVTFRLDASLRNKITGIRFDFPQTNGLLGIDKITLSSAGIIQKQYNPCTFFSPENVIAVNQAEYSLVTARNRVYIAPKGEDTYFVFQESLSREFNNGFSQFRLSRFCIVLFVLGSYFFAKKKVFKE